MASAQKLDSGSWRCRATITINGAKITQSFTVSPDEFPGSSPKEASKKARNQAELLAREWQISHATMRKNGKTVGEAIQSYIDNRLNILSPTTLRGYRTDQRMLAFLNDIYTQDVDTEMLQSIINEWTPRLSPKTIRSRIKFLLSVLDYVGIDKKFRVKYPAMIEKATSAPDHEEVSKLLENSSGVFKAIICVAAFGGLRRGEIASLKEKDIIRDMSMIYVHSDLVRKLDGGGYEYKDSAKTPKSTRTVHMPREVIDMIPQSDDPEAYVLPIRPDKITRRFMRLRNKLGINCTFHDLRHYAASMRSDLGLSSKYVKDQLGWTEKSKIYHEVYDDTLKSEASKFNKITNAFISENFGDVLKKKKA